MIIDSVCRTLGGRRARSRVLAGVCAGEQSRVFSDRAPFGPFEDILTRCSAEGSRGIF